MKNNRVERIIKRTYAYYYEDGLVELAVGMLFVATGIVVTAWQGLGSSTALTIFLALALPAVILSGIFLVNRSIQEAKERLIHPRTGYVSYRHERSRLHRRVLLVVGILLIIAAGLWPKALNRMPIMIGMLLGTILALLGYQAGVRRFWLLAPAAALIGLIVNRLVEDEMVASGVTFGAAGLVLSLSGACALWSYLKRNPQPREGDHE